MDQAGRQGGKRFGGGMSAGLAGIGSKVFAPLAAAAAGVSIGAFFKDAVSGASDLTETSSKVGVVFGSGAAQVEKFAGKGAQALGQTKQEVLNAAATFGTFGKSAGLGGKDLAKFSTDFAGLSTDMASFSNTSPEQAVQAIGAALRGESEPIRQYGVLLDDATLRNEALRLGLVKNTKTALTPQQKVLAAQAAIYKQTGDAQGDFQKTSGGLANQQRILAAQFTDIKTQVGSALLPVVTKLATVFTTTVLPAVQGFITQMQSGEGAGGTFVRILKSIGSAIGAVIGFLVEHKDFIGNYFKVAFVVASIPIRFLVAAIRTIIAIVKAVIAAVRAVVGAFKSAWNTVKSVTVAYWAAIGAAIRGAWNRIKAVVTAGLNGMKILLSAGWNTIKAVASRVWNAIKAVISAVWNAIKAVVARQIQGVKNAINGLSSIASTIGGFFQNAYNAVKDKIGSIVDFVKGLPGKITGVLGNMGSILYDAGSSIINGLLNGIKDAVTGVIDFVGGIAGRIRDAKGPESYDKKLLIPAGNWIIGGLQEGLESQYGSVHKSLQGFSRSLSVTGPTTTTAGMDAALVGRAMNVTYTGDVTVTDYEEFKREDNTRLRDFMTMANLAGAV
jgi:hypothetical protein